MINFFSICNLDLKWGQASFAGGYSKPIGSFNLAIRDKLGLAKVNVFLLGWHYWEFQGEFLKKKKAQVRVWPMH